MHTRGRGGSPGLDGRVAALVMLLAAVFLSVLLYYTEAVLRSLPNPIPVG
ncbi:hypothetical protein [Halobaculum limi]|nr:hypothetical protein [Halobaculum sp. YSMS11]